MKSNMLRTFLFGAALMLSLAAIPSAENRVASAQEDQTCSNAGFAGVYGHTLTGTLYLPSGAAPFAAIGRVTFDANGDASGSQTTSVSGRVSEDAIKATHTENSDCTGTLTVSIYNQSGDLLRTADWDTVTVANQTEYRAILKSLVMADGTQVPAVVTMEGRRLFSDNGNGQ